MIQHIFIIIRFIFHASMLSTSIPNTNALVEPFPDQGSLCIFIII